MCTKFLMDTPMDERSSQPSAASQMDSFLSPVGRHTYQMNSQPSAASQEASQMDSFLSPVGRHTYQSGIARPSCKTLSDDSSTANDISACSSHAILRVSLHHVSDTAAWARMLRKSNVDMDADGKDAVNDFVGALMDQIGGEEDVDSEPRRSEYTQVRRSRIQTQPAAQRASSTRLGPTSAQNITPCSPTASTHRVTFMKRLRLSAMGDRSPKMPNVTVSASSPSKGRSPNPNVTVSASSPSKGSSDTATESRETQPDAGASEELGSRPAAVRGSTHSVIDSMFRPSAYAHHEETTWRSQFARLKSATSRIDHLSFTLGFWLQPVRKKLRKLARYAKSLSTNSRLSALAPVPTTIIYKAMIRDARIIGANKLNAEAIHVDLAYNCDESNMWSVFDKNGQFVITCMDWVRLCGILVAPARFALSVELITRTNQHIPTDYVTGAWWALEGLLAFLVIVRTMWVSSVHDKLEVFGLSDNLWAHVRSINWWLDVWSLILFAVAVMVLDAASATNPNSGETARKLTSLVAFVIATCMRQLRVWSFSESPHFVYLWWVYFFGSIWYYIVSWLALMPTPSRVSQYLFCIRDVFTTFLGEDQGPSLDNRELLLRVLFGLIGLIFSIRVVVDILQSLDKSQRLKRCTSRRQALMKQGMELLPYDFERRVLTYFHFVTSVQDPLHKRTLLQSLSPTLKLELSFFVYQSVTTKTSFFYQLPCFLCKSLILALTDRFVCPGDYVIRKGELADETYFLLRGRLSVMLSLTSKECEVALEFNAADYFGETALLAHFWQYGGSPLPKRTAWVRAESYTQLAVLHNDNFEAAFEAYPDLKLVVAKRIIDDTNGKYADEWSRSLILSGMRSTKEKLEEKIDTSPESESGCTTSHERSSRTNAKRITMVKRRRAATFHNSLVNSLRMFVEEERRYFEDIVLLKYEAYDLLRVLDDKKQKRVRKTVNG